MPGLSGRWRWCATSTACRTSARETEPDALAALGFCHAQDRLWQMELLRRIVRGTLAELVGGAALGDRPLRPHARPGRRGGAGGGGARAATTCSRSRRTAAASTPGSGRETFRLPLELRLLLHRRVAEWTPVDALLGLRLFALGLGQNWEGEIVRSRLAARLGTAPPRAARARLSRDRLHVAAGRRRRGGAHGAGRQGPRGRRRGAGSNSWVLSADRTTTGAPLLANDPHLLLAAPCTWYAADIAWNGERCAGLTSPGTPGVVIGQTAHAAWGFTNVEADTQDLVEVDAGRLRGAARRADPRARQAAARGARGRHDRPRPRRHAARRGRDAHARAAVDGARAGARTCGAFRGLGRSRTADDVVAALCDVGGPTLNCVYATLAGDVGYQMCGGPVPRRASGDGRFPGTEPWLGTVPYDELPAWRNPADGTIVTANNRIVPDDYPHLISTEWLNPYRAQRIADLLAERARHTPADLARIQTDVYSLPLARLRDLVAGQEATDALERRALGLLAGWDGEMAAESAGAAIAATLMRHLTLEAYAETGRELERFLGAEGFSLLSPLLEFFGRTVPVTLDALERRDDGFFRDGRTWRGVIGKCLTRTCVELERRLGPDPRGLGVGRGPRARARPPAGRAARAASASSGAARTRCRARPTPCGRPRTRSPTPSAARRRVGPACGSWPTSPTRTRRDVLCGGQSGHPASPQYDDQVADWLAGRPRRLHWSPAAIERHRAATLCWIPA